MNRARALLPVLVLPLGCWTAGYRSSDPLEALLVAGTAAVATVASPPRAPEPSREPPRAAPPPPAPSEARVVTPDPAPVRRQPTTIDGYVVGEERGWPIPFAVVKFTDGHRPVERVRADAHGRFHVPPPLTTGRYILEVENERWEGSAEVEVVDGAGSNLWINVRERRAR